VPADNQEAKMPEFTTPATLDEARLRKAQYVEATKLLDWRDKPNSGGFSMNEEHVVFMKVSNPKGWKLAINTTVALTDEEVRILHHAIPNATGGAARIDPAPGKPGVYRVRAPGYYACIGA
jgi:hypothetical protein